MKANLRLSHTQIIALGFFLLILSGTVLLLLPISQRSGAAVTVSEALFTATSASCVTGLVVRDTWQTWSFFGQAVLLVLIQIGGLGFMTIATRFFMLIHHHKIGLREREILSESINSTRIGGILKLTRRIVFVTLTVEAAGALLLAIRFVPQFGGLGIWFAVFHAVSAFCNAGFDLMGSYGAYASFTAYIGDWLVSLTLIGLILIGGLGFVVWDNLATYRWHWKRYSLQSKLVLTSTLVLVLGGTVLFFLCERNATGAGHSTETQILAALFDAVTPRTAGFNTVDTAQLSEDGKLLSVVLMFIGGSPGSTAGGIKTTTIAVMLLYACAYVRREEEAHSFGRRIPMELLGKAAAVFFTNLILVLIATFLICSVQSLALTSVLFETVSAVSTVGMTTGITRDLLPVSRVVIMFLMYCGRVGGLSFATALAPRSSSTLIKWPVEEVLIG
ncbi:MAG: TrkH family potassium uptake protein [Oscillospiraceae bacterium]